MDKTISKHITETATELFCKEKDNILKTVTGLETESAVFYIQHIIEDPSIVTKIKMKFTGVKVSNIYGEGKARRKAINAVLRALQVPFLEVEYTTNKNIYVRVPKENEDELIYEESTGRSTVAR